MRRFTSIRSGLAGAQARNCPRSRDARKPPPRRRRRCRPRRPRRRYPPSRRSWPSCTPAQFELSKGEVLGVLKKQLDQEVRGEDQGDDRHRRRTGCAREEGRARADQQSWVAFEGKRTGWDVSIVEEEFAHSTGEAMLERWGELRRQEPAPSSSSTRASWKMFVSLDVSILPADKKNFQTFETVMQGQYGPGERRVRPHHVAHRRVPRPRGRQAADLRRARDRHRGPAGQAEPWSRSAGEGAAEAEDKRRHQVRARHGQVRQAGREGEQQRRRRRDQGAGQRRQQREEKVAPRARKGRRPTAPPSRGRWSSASSPRPTRTSRRW